MAYSNELQIPWPLPFHMRPTDPVLPIFHFASPTPPGGPERPSPVEDRKKRLATSLARDIMELNDTYYGQYGKTSNVADEEKEKIKTQEEKDIIKLVQPHMLDVHLATDDTPSPQAKNLTYLAYCINNIAQRDLETETDAARRDVLQKQRQEDLTNAIMQYVNVGQERPIEYPAPPPPRPRIHERAMRGLQEQLQRLRREQTAVENRRWLHRGEGFAAALLVSAAIVGVYAAKSNADNAVSPTILAPGKCVNALNGTIAVGYDYSIDGKAASNGSNTATVIEFVNPGKFCAGTRRASVQYLGSTDLGHMNTVANNYKTQLQQQGCADSNGCEYIIMNIH